MRTGRRCQPSKTASRTAEGAKAGSGVTSMGTRQDLENGEKVQVLKDGARVPDLEDGEQVQALEDGEQIQDFEDDEQVSRRWTRWLG